MKQIVKSIFLLALTSLLIVKPIESRAAYTSTNDAYTLVNYLNGQVGNDYTANRCQAFVYNSLVNSLGVYGAKACAYEAWLAFGVSTDRNIPLGAAVYFSGGSYPCGDHIAGHVGLYVGDGYVVHVAQAKVQKTLLSSIESWSGYSYLGWGWQGGYALANYVPDYTEPPTNVSVSVNKSLYVAGETVTFTCAGTNVSGYTIGITKDGNRIYTGDINAVYETCFSEPGNYAAYVTAWNSIGSVDSQWITFSVYNTMPTIALISINKENFLIGETFTITFGADAACEYYLSIYNVDSGELVDSGNKPQTYSTAFQKAGHYTACMSAYNTLGTAHSSWIDFYVFGAPPTSATLTTDKSLLHLGESLSFKTVTDAYYVKIYMSIYEADGSIVYEGNIPYSFTYTPAKAGEYTTHISAYTHEGSIDSNYINFRVYDYVPADPWITADKTAIMVNENITFSYNASNVTYFDLGFDRYGERVHSTRREGYDTTYTTSFDKPGTYTVYISAYNEYGYSDSRKVTFTVHDKEFANIGEVFYGKILNREYWKPIKNNNLVATINTEEGLADELWKFIRQEDGSYEIASCLDGKNLMAEKNEDNTVMQVLVGNTVEITQKQWFLYENNGGLILKPKCSEYVLDLENESDANGNRVFLRAEDSGINQVFSVYKGDDVQLTAPKLKINGAEYGQVDICWNVVSSLVKYKIKVFSIDNLDIPIYVDDIDASLSSYRLELPRGCYTATVTAYNFFEGMESNRITFDIVIPIFVEVSKIDSQLSFQCVFNLKDAENAMVVLGAFDREDNLLAAQKVTYDTNITFDMDYQELMNSVKLFVWKDMIPVCDPEIIPKSAWSEAEE